MIEVIEGPIATGNIYERISSYGSGSIVVHFGVVKPVKDDRKTSGIRFTLDGDLEGELKNLENRIRGNWEVTDVLLIRRVGELRIGDVILVAAVSAPTRDAAFSACQDAVDNLKKIPGLKKEELFEEFNK
jgi:molybdopterin synthase catalytic subunit